METQKTIFSYHLYRKPLYEFLGENETILNVLLLGFGQYGQEFLDCCLQAGQMKDIHLRVKIISKNIAAEKAAYLQSRPAFCDFFDIDGADSGETSYGKVMFAEGELSAGNTKKRAEENLTQIKEVIGEEFQPHYILIALGEDALNKTIAKNCAEFSEHCSVNYTYQGSRIRGKSHGTPVYMCEEVAKLPEFKEIERMAFNAHLVWQKGLNVDMKKQREEFQSLYNYDSSLANVLSVKYKLHSAGIEMDDLEEAAKMFRKKVSGSSGKAKIKNELVMTEHKRWVVEKICAGWTCRTNYEKCLSGSINDGKKKQHVCILKSSAQQKLSAEFSDLRRWDTASAEELDKLDPLDHMSVELHRTFKKKADEIKKQDILSGPYIMQIRTLIQNNKKASIAFAEWYSCLKLIWNNNANQHKLYDVLKNTFVNALDELEAEEKKNVKILVKMIDKLFYPILQSMVYDNYKEKDVALVEGIPFILTYRHDIHLVIPFSMGDISEVFNNVASATIANPEKLTYLCHINKQSEIAALEETLEYVTNYIERKWIRSNVQLLIAHKEDEKLALKLQELQKKLKADKRKKIKKVQLLPITPQNGVASVFQNALNEKKTGLIAVERNEAKLSYLLMGAGFYEQYPNYQFNSATKKFHALTDCEALRYIRAEQYLRISDMVSMKNSSGTESAPELYRDFNDLWSKVYKKNTTAWKVTCKVLEAYSDEHDMLASFSLDAKDTKTFEARYTVPAFTFYAVNKIIRFLSEEMEIIDKNSEIHYQTTDSCEIYIKAAAGYKDAFHKLFANPYKLLSEQDIICKKHKRKAEIIFDDLVVDGVCVKDYPEFSQHEGLVCSLLQALASKGCINNLREGKKESNKEFRFTYATRQMKELLTKAGRILEVYVYHKCLESNLFDDIASGYEVKWNDTIVNSEFDCILTKGFQSLFIECKARGIIEQDYYYKLSCLAKQFGINATAVLIADTQEKAGGDNEINDKQRERGEMLDVVTISKPEEINNIARTLAAIFKKNEE